MTTTEQPRELRSTGIGALAAPVTGYVAFVLAMVSGEYFLLNTTSRLNPGHDPSLVDALTEAWEEAALGLVGLAIAVTVATRVWKGQAATLAKTSLGFALVAALTVVAFWSGWPIIFGATAVGLAAEHRRRIGSFGVSSAIGLGLGALASIAAIVICVTG